MKQVFALAPLALLAACSPAPPMGPRPPADTYRALGTEPFWNLTLTSREMAFNEPNGPTTIVQPTPRPIIGVAGEIYQTPRLNVNVVHAQCSDGMSDRIYPDKVQVTADGRRFEGCGGGAVTPVMLSTTQWRVTGVNRHATPASVDFYMNFDADRFTAKFGCNRITGSYDLTGDTLTAGPVAGTRMACPDMNFESQAGAILSHPMRTSFRTGDVMVLANGAGSIELKRTF